MQVEQYSVLENQRVLVVDDQIEACFPVIMLLQLHGAEVTAVRSAREALQVLERSEVDVLLSDIQMPGENGYSLMRKVISLFPNAQERPVGVAMSGLAYEENCQQALVAGFQAYLHKPFDGSELLMMLAALLERRVTSVELAIA